MRNGWTGGQYSVYRVLLGAYVAIQFAHLVPWGWELWSGAGVLPDSGDSPLLRVLPNVLALIDAPWFVTTLLGAAVGAAAMLAIGVLDRASAVFLWYVLAVFFGRSPLIANPALPYVGWLLLAHALTPRAPYGSWSARGRPDPGNHWALSPLLFTGAWIAMSVVYGSSGITKLASSEWRDGSAAAAVLESPLARPTSLRTLMLSLPDLVLQLATWGALALEIAFPLLAIFRRTRQVAWLAIVGMHVALLVLLDFAGLTFGMLVLHAFTFDPAWIEPRRPDGVEHLFYDGGCGLCHRAVRFALAEAPGDAALVFAPLGSEAFRDVYRGREDLPDSLAYAPAEGELLFRTDAVVRLLERLGGGWRVAAALLRLIPRPLRDAGYDGIAATRHLLFRKPDDACPIIPPHLRGRFAL